MQRSGKQIKLHNLSTVASDNNREILLENFELRIFCTNKVAYFCNMKINFNLKNTILSEKDFLPSLLNIITQTNKDLYTSLSISR